MTLIAAISLSLHLSFSFHPPSCQNPCENRIEQLRLPHQFQIRYLLMRKTTTASRN